LTLPAFAVNRCGSGGGIGGAACYANGMTAGDASGRMMAGAFGRIMLGLMCCAALAFQSLGPAAAEEIFLTVTAMVDPVKINGSPWDGLPAVGGRIVAPTATNAPDIAFCVVLAAGEPECYWRKERGRTISVCEDTTRCTIDKVRFPQLPAGLIFLEVDLVRHDLIDFVILTGGNAPIDEMEKLEANMRRVMASLTPGTTPADRERRQRKARALPLELCIGETSKCDLSQMRFWLERK
jgi:hypothetical protein